jgi:nitronate monooxygenase
MFIVSYPELVLAQCKAGIVGSFPRSTRAPPNCSTNGSRRSSRRWPTTSAANPDAVIGPIAVNQIVHQSNARLEHDMRVCVEHKVPIFITSLRAPARDRRRGAQLRRHRAARRHQPAPRAEGARSGRGRADPGRGRRRRPRGHDVAVRAGGRSARMFDGPIVLSGAIANGGSILAAQAMGADLAYMGTRFIATQEAHAVEAYKHAILNAKSSDIVYTNLFTGVHGNYIRESIERRLDPDALPESDKSKMISATTRPRRGRTSGARARASA